MNKLNDKVVPLKKLKLSKKDQENEDKIKINMRVVNQNFNDWKFQIHLNKPECDNPRSFIERKSILCVF